MTAAPSVRCAGLSVPHRPRSPRAKAPGKGSAWQRVLLRLSAVVV